MGYGVSIGTPKPPRPYIGSHHGPLFGGGGEPPCFALLGLIGGSGAGSGNFGSTGDGSDGGNG